jgi:hypothetical protein
MGIQIADQVTIGFNINGTEIPIQMGSFSELSVCENIQTKLPTMEFQISDPSTLLHDVVGLGDGSIVTITLHSDYGFDNGPPQSVPYLVMGTKMEIPGAKLLYTCNGVYNAPIYLGGMPTKAYTGTSSSVISTLASEAGLGVKSTDQTNDSQNWLPSRENYSDFIHNIADHGYVDANSIMSLGVNDSGQIIYKNLTTLATAPPSRVIMSGDPTMISEGIIPCTGYEVTNLAGLGNFMYNYGTKLVQEKLTGLAQTFSQYTATMFSNFLNMSSAVKGLIGGAVRSEYLPHDMGNQHDKYFDAEYQNRRGRQLFTTTVKVYTANSSGLDLYDVVTFIPILPVGGDGAGEISASLTGNYIVTAKTKFISGLKYAECLELMAQGPFTSPSGVPAGGLVS